VADARTVLGPADEETRGLLMAGAHEPCNSRALLVCGNPIMTSRRSRFDLLAVYALVALAALALPLEGSEPIHVHHGEVPALYNGECPLAALAAFNGVAPLPSAPASMSRGLAQDPPALLGAASPFALVVRHTDPLAPPSA
jgi:hypothetical protein